MGPTLTIAANGHVALDFGDCDSELYPQACATLESQLGFTRRGRTCAGCDEGITPSFFRADVEIFTGWDNWSDCYLLANSDAGDKVLRHVYAQLA